MGKLKHFIRFFNFCLAILLLKCQQKDTVCSKTTDNSIKLSTNSGLHKSAEQFEQIPKERKLTTGNPSTSETFQEMLMTTERISKGHSTNTDESTTIDNNIAPDKHVGNTEEIKRNEDGLLTELKQSSLNEEDKQVSHDGTASSRTGTSNAEPTTQTFVNNPLNENEDLNRRKMEEEFTKNSVERLKTKISENLDFLCPTGRVCRSSSIGHLLPGKSHCCKECSCSTECGYRNQTCCFANDAMNAHTVYFGQECLHVTTSLIKHSERHSYKAYNMEANCPPECRADSAVNGSCGEESVAPWGSLYPVYSQSTDKIFKNSACALCNDVSDGVPWEVSMVCDMFADEYKTKKQNIANFQSFLDGYNPEGLCYVNFKPPVPFSSIENHECTPDPITTCSDEEFFIPENLNLSKEEIIQACTSGFSSSYKKSGAYSNVFCHICNNETLQSNPICSPNNLYPREWFRTKFTTIVDKAFLDNRYNGQKGKNMLPEACVSNKDTSKKCRTLYCPSGKTYDANGHCIFPSTEWDVDIYEIILKLEPETPIPFEYIRETANTFKISNLKSSFPDRWIIQSLSYMDPINASTVDNIIAKVRLPKVFKHPGNVLKSIGRYMKSKWYITVNGTRFGLILDFSEIRDTVNTGGFTIPKFTQFPDNNSTLNEIKWTLLYNPLLFASKPSIFKLTVTKMFYCHQIELYPGEFEFLHLEYVLYHKEAGKYFFDGEFVVVTSKDTGKHRPRICVEDSGFTWQNAGGRKLLHSYTLLAMLTLVILL